MCLGQLLRDQCVSVFTGIPKEQKASEKWAELSQNFAMFFKRQLELLVPTVPAFGIPLKVTRWQSQSDAAQQNESGKGI